MSTDDELDVTDFDGFSEMIDSIMDGGPFCVCSSGPMYVEVCGPQRCARCGYRWPRDVAKREDVRRRAP